MAIISFSSTPTKNSTSTVTLNKSELYALTPISSNSFWNVPTNISQISIVYESTIGGQNKVLNFDASLTSPTDTMPFSSRARDNFSIKRIVLKDFDGGELSINRQQLSSLVTISELDIELVPPPSAYELAIAADSPYFYYRFNETSGTSISDSSGFNRNATVSVVGNIGYNGAGPVTGGKAIFFDQTRITTDFTTNSNSPISIEWWFKTPNGFFTERGMVSRWTGIMSLNSSNLNPYFALRYTGGNIDAFNVQGNNFENQYVGQYESVLSPYQVTALTNNSWHHVVYTQTLTQRVLYLDGVAVDTKTGNFAPPNFQAPWHMGGGENWVSPQWFYGYMAEFAVYQSELSAARVLAHYQAASI